MARRPGDGHLVAIVGATATGKSALAVALTRAFGGEIVNADSRQVYRGMDIGTAKPTHAERHGVPHWLLDVASPDETFTLARFIDLASAAFDDIWSRGKQPVLVGGTGQHMWALLEGWRVPRVPPDADLRAELERRAAGSGVESLLRELAAIDPVSAASIDPRNVRRLIRAIEVTKATGRPFSEWRQRDPPPFEARIIGLRMSREPLYRRIDARVDAMMSAGLLDEVRTLHAEYGCDAPAMASIGYRELCAHLRAELSLLDAVACIKTETHRLVRMQHAWFKAGDARIHWLDAGDDDLSERALAALR